MLSYIFVFLASRFDSLTGVRGIFSETLNEFIDCIDLGVCQALVRLEAAVERSKAAITAITKLSHVPLSSAVEAHAQKPVTPKVNYVSIDMKYNYLENVADRNNPLLSW